VPLTNNLATNSQLPPSHITPPFYKTVKLFHTKTINYGLLPRQNRTHTRFNIPTAPQTITPIDIKTAHPPFIPANLTITKSSFWLIYAFVPRSVLFCYNSPPSLTHLEFYKIEPIISTNTTSYRFKTTHTHTRPHTNKHFHHILKNQPKSPSTPKDG